MPGGLDLEMATFMAARGESYYVNNETNADRQGEWG